MTRTAKLALISILLVVACFPALAQRNVKDLLPSRVHTVGDSCTPSSDGIELVTSGGGWYCERATRTWQVREEGKDQAGPLFNVTHPAYGCDPNQGSGVDLTSCFATVVAAAEAAECGIVYVPVGEYYGHFNLGDCVSLQGEAAAFGSGVQLHHTTEACLIQTDPTKSVREVTISNLYLNGDSNPLDSSWTEAHGICIKPGAGDDGSAQDGGTHATIMTDSTADLTVDAWIGDTIYNSTDGTSCTITDNDQTTVTCAPAGSNWDNGDAWRIGGMSHNVVSIENVWMWTISGRGIWAEARHPTNQLVQNFTTKNVWIKQSLDNGMRILGPVLESGHFKLTLGDNSDDGLVGTDDTASLVVGNIEDGGVYRHPGRVPFEKSVFNAGAQCETNPQGTPQGTCDWSVKNGDGDTGTMIFVEAGAQVSFDHCDFEEFPNGIHVGDSNTTDFVTGVAIRNSRFAAADLTIPESYVVELNHFDGLVFENNQMAAWDGLCGIRYTMSTEESRAAGDHIGTGNVWGDATEAVCNREDFYTTLSGNAISLYNFDEVVILSAPAASTTDLNNIYDRGGGVTQLYNGQCVKLRTLLTGSDVNINDGAGNIETGYGDYTLASRDDIVEVCYAKQQAKWIMSAGQRMTVPGADTQIFYHDGAGGITATSDAEITATALEITDKEVRVTTDQDANGVIITGNSGNARSPYLMLIDDVAGDNDQWRVQNAAGNVFNISSKNITDAAHDVAFTLEADGDLELFETNNNQGPALTLNNTFNEQYWSFFQNSGEQFVFLANKGAAPGVSTTVMRLDDTTFDLELREGDVVIGDDTNVDRCVIGDLSTSDPSLCFDNGDSVTITAVANIVLDGDVKATAFNLEDATDIALNVDESTGTDYAGVRFGNGSADNVLLRYLASSDTFETYVGGPNSITAGDGNESNIFRKIDVGAGTATYHSNYARIYEADVAASAVLDHTDNAYSNPFIMDDCNLWDDQAGDLRAKCGGSPASAIDGMTLTGLAHGDISVLGNAVATAIAAKDTYYQVTVFDTNSATEFLVDADHTNDHIQVDEAGTYLASLSASFNGNANNEYHLQLHKNNGATAFANVHISRKIGNGGDVGAAAVVGLVQLSANDTVELWVENKTGGNDMTIFESNISLVRVY